MKILKYINSALIAFSIISAVPSLQTPVMLETSMGVQQVGIYEEVLNIQHIYNKENSFKAYMDYRTITDKTSKQWKMQTNAYTDRYGLRKIGEYYCIALGSGISDKLGSKFEIELSSGKKFKAILADQKSDCHTDSTNTHIQLSGGRINVIEFIVQDEMMPQVVRQMGNLDYLPGELLKGQVIKIRELKNDKAITGY